jgi:hypothetical protein
MSQRNHNGESRRKRHKPNAPVVVVKEVVRSAPRQRRRIRSTAGPKLVVARTNMQHKRRSKMNTKSNDVFIPYFEEDLGQVTTPGQTYTTSTFNLNPANSRTFPWFSGIASKFEQYKSSKYVFIENASSGESVGSTTTSLGTVLMNTCYDVLDTTAFATLQSIRDYGMEGAHRSCAEKVPFLSNRFQVQEKGKKGGDKDGFRYCLASSLATPTYPTSSSAHDYDIGYFTVATQGQQAASTLGSLRVGWSGWLRSRLVNQGGAGVLAAHFFGTTPTTANNLATLVVKPGNTFLPVLGVNTITFPSNAIGTFLITYIFNGTTSHAGLAVSTVTNGTNAPAMFTGDTGAGVEVGQGTANYISIVAVTLTAGSAVVTYSPGAIVNPLNLDLIINQIPSSILTSHFNPTEQFLNDKVELLSRQLTSLMSYVKPELGGVLPVHPSLVLRSVLEPCSPDEFKTTDCDLKCCVGCQVRPASIGGTYCSSCTQRIEMKHKNLRVAWVPDS